MDRFVQCYQSRHDGNGYKKVRILFAFTGSPEWKPAKSTRIHTLVWSMPVDLWAVPSNCRELGLFPTRNCFPDFFFERETIANAVFICHCAAFTALVCISSWFIITRTKVQHFLYLCKSFFLLSTLNFQLHSTLNSQLIHSWPSRVKCMRLVCD